MSPAASNASTTSFKPSASQQTYSGQIKKKKKIKRVLDSDDETPCTSRFHLSDVTLYLADCPAGDV